MNHTLAFVTYALAAASGACLLGGIVVLSGGRRKLICTGLET